MRMRCQENGEGAALSLAPLLEGPLLGCHRLQLDLSHPHPGFPCISGASPDRRGKACVPPAYHRSQLPAYTRSKGNSSQARPSPPSWPPCSTGWQGEASGHGDCLPFAQGLLSPPPLFPEAPASRLLVRLWVQTQGWLFLPTPSWGPLRTRPPGLEMAAAPQLVLCSQLWWLDLVLNNELLKPHGQCVSHVLTHAEPLL